VRRSKAQRKRSTAAGLEATVRRPTGRSGGSLTRIRRASPRRLQARTGQRPMRGRVRTRSSGMTPKRRSSKRATSKRHTCAHARVAFAGRSCRRFRGHVFPVVARRCPLVRGRGRFAICARRFGPRELLRTSFPAARAPLPASTGRAGVHRGPRSSSRQSAFIGWSLRPSGRRGSRSARRDERTQRVLTADGT
jgi:hypothetical protein